MFLDASRHYVYARGVLASLLLKNDSRAQSDKVLVRPGETVTCVSRAQASYIRDSEFYIRERNFSSSHCLEGFEGTRPASAPLGWLHLFLLTALARRISTSPPWKGRPNICLACPATNYAATNEICRGEIVSNWCRMITQLPPRVFLSRAPLFRYCRVDTDRLDSFSQDRFHLSMPRLSAVIGEDEKRVFFLCRADLSIFENKRISYLDAPVNRMCFMRFI